MTVLYLSFFQVQTIKVFFFSTQGMERRTLQDVCLKSYVTLIAEESVPGGISSCMHLIKAIS